MRCYGVEYFHIYCISVQIQKSSARTCLVMKRNPCARRVFTASDALPSYSCDFCATEFPFYIKGSSSPLKLGAPKYFDPSSTSKGDVYYPDDQFLQFIPLFLSKSSSNCVFPSISISWISLLTHVLNAVLMQLHFFPLLCIDACSYRAVGVTSSITMRSKESRTSDHMMLCAIVVRMLCCFRGEKVVRRLKRSTYPAKLL